MELLDPNDIWSFKDEILSKVSIIDIAREYGIELEEKETGNFTHRAYCILHSGKGPSGKERTPSLFFSKHSNSFCCFGCSLSGSLLDFIQYVDGTPSVVILNKLAKKIGIINNNDKYDLKFCPKNEVFDPLKTINPYIFKISDMLREYIFNFINSKDFDKEFVWFEKVSQKVDNLLISVKYDDWEYAKDLCERIGKVLKNRIKSKK